LKSQFSFNSQLQVKQGVRHTVALPFSILMQKKKNYGNSNISPCQNVVFKKSSKRNQNPSRYYNSITISNPNTSQNIIFQESSYKNRPTTWGPKSLKLLYSIMNLNTISLPTKARPKRLWLIVFSLDCTHIYGLGDCLEVFDYWK